MSDKLHSVISLRLDTATIRQVEDIAARRSAAFTQDKANGRRPRLNKDETTFSHVLRKAIDIGLAVGFYEQDEETLRNLALDVILKDVQCVLAYAVASQDGAAVLKKILDRKDSSEYDFG